MTTKENSNSEGRTNTLSPLRKFLKVFHPEGIPFPGTFFYNSVSKSNIFQKHYELVADDVMKYCSDGNVLDIGTGPGWLLSILHKKSPKLKLTGIDISPSMVSKARKNMADAGFGNIIEIKEGGANNIPYLDETFDLVISTGTLHHWKDPGAGLNEIHRVLKCGGYGLMYDLVSDTPKHILKESAHEFGKFKMFLLWMHAFEEPFYSYKNFGLLVDTSLFKKGQAKFVGVMCCLVLKKEKDDLSF